uniref:RHS repeat-associated core domain-containing protein n=1 Tax=Tautonia marina TaxID=2653855 RepID=UPI0036F2CDB1
MRVQADADGAGPGAPATTWTVYDDPHAYADFDGSGTLQTRYLHGPAVDMLLARTSAAGTSAWYLTDRLGSVRDLASTSGTVINHVAYDGFGKVLSESSPAHGDRFKFTGREQDAVTGLQYNRARYYDAAIGRWTQEDPIGFAAGDANLYRYVGNGPTNFVDPDGLQKRYWGQSLVEAGRWSWDVGSAGALGALQGVANLANGVTDVAAETGNMLIDHSVPGRHIISRWVPCVGYDIPSPDWSRDLIVHESETCHNISKFSGGTGLTFLVSAPNGVRSVAGRIVPWAGKARHSLAPTRNFAKYGSAQQRQTVLNQARATGTLSEAKGVVNSFREMKRLGYELQDVSLRYRGNQGLDLIFHNGSRHAVVEAKHGKSLSLLKTDKGCLRQGSLDYNISRLERYIQYGDGTHNHLANQLLNEAYIGQLESFGTFYRSGRVLELPIGWPNVPPIRR